MMCSDEMLVSQLSSRQKYSNVVIGRCVPTNSSQLTYPTRQEKFLDSYLQDIPHILCQVWPGIRSVTGGQSLDIRTENSTRRKVTSSPSQTAAQRTVAPDTRLRGRLWSARHLKCYALCFCVCSLLALRHDKFRRDAGLINWIPDRSSAMWSSNDLSQQIPVDLTSIRSAPIPFKGQICEQWFTGYCMYELPESSEASWGVNHWTLEGKTSQRGRWAHH